MSTRSTETTLTFARPFRLGALDEAQPAGTYLLVNEEELIQGLSFPAYQRTATLLQLPAIATASPMRQMVPVTPDELAVLLRADAAPA